MSNPVVDFRAFDLSVSVSSNENGAWNFIMTARGGDPPDHYSLRNDVMMRITDRLEELKRELGTPPSDLKCTITEVWAIKEICLGFVVSESKEKSPSPARQEQR